MVKITIKKKGNESADQVLARFNKRVQSARIVKDLRSVRYHARNKSPLKQKIAALIRERYRAEKEKTKHY